MWKKIKEHLSEYWLVYIIALYLAVSMAMLWTGNLAAAVSWLWLTVVTAFVIVFEQLGRLTIQMGQEMPIAQTIIQFDKHSTQHLVAFYYTCREYLAKYPDEQIIDLVRNEFDRIIEDEKKEKERGENVEER